MGAISLVEWIGYMASALVLVSMLMSSVIKLRWINLLGAAIFSLYGFLIGSIPVGSMNLIISAINIYYLIKIYTTTDYFKILPIEKNSSYTKYFLKFYESEIKKYFSRSDFSVEDHSVGFYILRNMIPAGIFLASRQDEKTLLIDLDFAIPEYRDLKTGKYLYEYRKDILLEMGYTKLVSYSQHDRHSDYLLKMGFVKNIEGNKEIFTKNLL